MAGNGICIILQVPCDVFQIQRQTDLLTRAEAAAAAAARSTSHARRSVPNVDGPIS
jgi:hypothetical protein